MPEENSISEATLRALLARAAELDDAASPRTSLSRARAIATEAGISPAAWDAALQELSTEEASFGERPDDGFDLRETLLVGFLGLVVGGLMGFSSHASAGRMDVIAGGAVIIASLAVGARVFRGSLRAHIELAAWWAAVPAGIMLGFGTFLTDPLWYAGLSWVATATVGAGVSYLRRRWKLRESAA